jgi:hypothetical protein
MFIPYRRSTLRGPTGPTEGVVGTHKGCADTIVVIIKITPAVKVFMRFISFGVSYYLSTLGTFTFP